MKTTLKLAASLVVAILACAPAMGLAQPSPLSAQSNAHEMVASGINMTAVKAKKKMKKMKKHHKKHWTKKGKKHGKKM